MTTTPPDPTETASAISATAPPPGCPAHGLDSEGLANLFGEENQADPMGLYERLRKDHGQVAPVLLAGDLPAWLVLGYRENLEVARTPSRFTRDSRIWRSMKEGKVPQDSPILPMVAWNPSCVFVDGEEHERLRKALTESLARFDRRGVRRHVTRFANQLVDGFSSKGQADLVGEFAEQLPMLVMTHLLGMPDDYGPRLAEATRDLIKGTETAVTSNEYVTETIRQLVARKREAPGYDFTSWLVTHDAGLTDDEVLQHARLVLIAANETTIHLIVNTLRMVLTDRRFRASLAGGHMTLPDAVEHVLWNEPPLGVIPARFATSDTEIAGQRIKSGDMVLLGPAAGNVDPEIRPDLAASMHGNRSHLSFSGGSHECPGQDIGRAITDTAIDTLLMRLPDLRLAGDETELNTVSTWMSRHLVALPVEFTPRKPEPETAASAAPSATVGRGAAPGSQPAAPSSTGTGATTPGPSQPIAPNPVAGQRTSWWASAKRWLRGR